MTRQAEIETTARAACFYIAGVYCEKTSGARADRPELLSMIADLQPGDVVVAKSIDRISRLPFAEAEKLIASIRATGARLSVPGIINLTDLAATATAEGVAKVVLESVQDMLLKLALQMVRDDYEIRHKRQQQGIVLAKLGGKFGGRKPDTLTHERIVALWSANLTITDTARLTGCLRSQVNRVLALHLAAGQEGQGAAANP